MLKFNDMNKLRELLIANGINPNDAVQRGKSP